MTLKDRFRRLRRAPGSPPDSHTDAKPASKDATSRSSPSNQSPISLSTTASTGQATPAATQTPVAAASRADLPSTSTQPQDAPLAHHNTLEEMLVERATTNSSATNGEKKKRRGLFRKKEDPYKDWPDDVYKPHEVPPPKYKRTPDPKHIENLHAFSFGAGAGGFGGLVRRLSQQSGVSPGGSKWQSPFGSRANSRAPSRLASANPSRNPSIAEDPHGEEVDVKASGISSPAKLSRPGTGARGISTKSLGQGKVMQATGVDRVAEEDGEGEGGNAGSLSRPKTADDDEGPPPGTVGHAKAESTNSNDMPFTEQQLTQALTRATLQGNAGQKIIDTPPS